MIFTREINDPLTGLVKKLDAQVGKAGKNKMAAIVVVLTDDEGAEKKLKDLADVEQIKNVSLAVLENPAGPPAYKIAKDAEVTVLLYKQHKVAANHAFKKGQFSEKSVEEVVADLPKIIQ
jgi:hypothetical protein